MIDNKPFESTVIDVISDSMANSAATVKALTDAPDGSILAKYKNLVFSLRSFSKDAQAKVAVPLIETTFEKLGLSLEHDALLDQHVELMDLIVNDALGAIRQQMQNEANQAAAARRALEQGHGSKLLT